MYTDKRKICSAHFVSLSVCGPKTCVQVNEEGQCSLRAHPNQATIIEHAITSEQKERKKLQRSVLTPTKIISNSNPIAIEPIMLIFIHTYSIAHVTLYAYLYQSISTEFGYRGVLTTPIIKHGLRQFFNLTHSRSPVEENCSIYSNHFLLYIKPTITEEELQNMHSLLMHEH